MAKIVIFSLDYDGCSDVLFDETLKEKFKGFYDKELLPLRKKLNDFLVQKADESEAKVVELYVGSIRQSHLADKEMMIAQENGSCFTNFEKLCKDKSKNGKTWKLQPLLLADIENGKPAGSALKDAKLDCEPEKNKTDIMQLQVLDAAKRHPNDEVHFYFLDDDGEKSIFPSLKAYFEQEDKAQKTARVPSNLHIHLVKFDWFGEVMEHQPTLVEFAHIQGKKVPELVKGSDKQKSAEKPVKLDTPKPIPAAKGNYQTGVTLFDQSSPDTTQSFYVSKFSPTSWF